jgi:hypothetical protein
LLAGLDRLMPQGRIAFLLIRPKLSIKLASAKSVHRLLVATRFLTGSESEY